MKNETLKKFAIAEAKKQLKKHIDSVKCNYSNDCESTKEEIISSWWFKEIFTKREIKKILNNAHCTKESILKLVVLKKIEEATEATNKFIDSLDSVVNIELPKEIQINVEWKHSRTWGYNPTAEVWANVYSKSSSISGCGYDKRSAATAEAFNKNEVFKKILLICAYNDHKNKNKTYGYYWSVFSGIYFEGGVGFESHDHILINAGYKNVNRSGGKAWDSYTYILNKFVKRG